MIAPSDIAKYFLSKCDEDAGDTISNLKLQKLLYYAQGFHLAIAEGPLFDESIEAWRHGPVVPSVYREYSDYGSNSIEPPLGFVPNTIPEASQDILDEVYEVYGQFSAWRLREMTHEEAPWKNAWNPDSRGDVITQDSMRQFFSDLIED